MDIANIYSLPIELITLIVINLKLSDIVNLCLCCHYFDINILNNEIFWYYKFIQRHGEPDYNIENWKEEYLNYMNIWLINGSASRHVFNHIKAKRIMWGCEHLVVMNNNDEIWLHTNKYGQLDSTHLIEPINIKAKQIDVNSKGSIVLDFDGNVYIYGKTHRLLATGMKAIASGWFDIVVIDHEQNLWVCGTIGRTLLKQGKFKLLSATIKAEVVSVGLYHTILLDTENNIWIYGCNSRGQLGLGDNVRRYSLTRIHNIKAKYVHANLYRTFIIDMNDNIWFCGDNKFVFTKIEGIQGKKIATTTDKIAIIDLNNNLWILDSRGSRQKIEGFKAIDVTMRNKEILIIGTKIK